VSAMAHLPEKRESLWMLTISPVIWSLHFLLSYVTAAVWCEKMAGRDGSLWDVRVAIAVYTLVGLIGIGITGWIGFRRHSFGDAETPHRSFSTHSLGVKVPRLGEKLGEPGMVLRGAGHYETACRPCHGSPDLPHPRIAGAMLPVPPYLPDVIHEWKPAELFSVVKHGVKLTGMPAWPAQQRDEVWAMVAFLLAMPKLNAEEYRRLVHGEIPAPGGGEPMPDLLGTEPPRAVLATCARCHGVDGRGRIRGAFPRLAGQRPTYLYESLQAFARGKRHSGIMEPIAAGLTPSEMRDLARYFASLPAAPAVRQESTGAIERGRAIAHRGIPGRKVPSCADCHGPGAIRRNPVFPMLAGQDALYLVQQLELFKKKTRGGSPFARLMHPVAGQMSTEEMRDVALYYESLGALTPDPLSHTHSLPPGRGGTPNHPDRVQALGGGVRMGEGTG
jgi:cytochrome c553